MSTVAESQRILLRVEPELPRPAEPVRLAIIGAGNRSSTVYAPLLDALRPWVRPVAVCDPVRPNADALASRLRVPAFHDIRELVRARPIEAALVVTPIDSHHAISVFLSSNRVPHLTETAWATMLRQAREMLEAARRHGVIARVAENFFRFPIDRLAQAVRDSGCLGRIGRVFSYADHTGYHNNSRWIAFAGAAPRWVQCVEHVIEHPPFYSMPQRLHTRETLSARFFGFPDDFLVMDTGSGHVKGHLGRHPRPGYTEWQGERGTLVHRAVGPHGWDRTETELRRCSDAKLAAAQAEPAQRHGGGVADEVTPVVHESVEGQWLRSFAETPQGWIEYINPLHPSRRGDGGGGSVARVGKAGMADWYGVAVMDHLVDFALAVRGLRPSEFTDADALMSQMMEAGAHESALRQGQRIALPLDGELEADALARQSLREKLGVDPLDAEAMLAISYPRP